MAILCDAEMIEAKHLPEEIRKSGRTQEEIDIPSTWEEFKTFKQQVKDDIVSQIEKDFLIAALKDGGGNVSRAAKQIGMQRTNFHSLLKKHSINTKD